MFSFLNDDVREEINFCGKVIEKRYTDIYDKAKNRDPASWNEHELVAVIYISAWRHLAENLKYPEIFEKRTAYCRDTAGKHLTNRIFLQSEPRFYLHVLLRFAWEYNLCLSSNLFNLDHFCLQGNFLEKLDNVRPEVWGGDSNNHSFSFSWIKNNLPFEVYKDFLNSNNLKEAKKLTDNIEFERERLKDSVNDIIEKATSSVEYLDAVRKEADDLGARLTDIKREGNFKLLAKAFSTIRKEKKKEVIYAQFRAWSFIVLLILLPISLFSYFFFKDIPLNWSSSLHYIPLVSLELLFFYFMRLFYVEVKSLKSQLVQIDLRLNLCEFIYDYVETKDKTSHSEKVDESWKSFEALIFSPIQPNEDKIPSVMDGTDVLADLVGKVLKAKG
ncbi:hypothetical protein [Erwinia sp. OPT-41]|uniref:Uncharacterized protein n=1 Tax=Erwinia plantamica TaxID=3237104 RepID=A0ABW7CJ27_9GAMM